LGQSQAICDFMPWWARFVHLDTDDVEIARRIAARIRERGGGPPGVKALGLRLASRRHAQVSVNITEPDRVSLDHVFERVRQEAARHGVAVTGSELVGALRMEDLLAVCRRTLGLRGLDRSQVLDLWMEEGSGQ
jgi:glutamate formiminotransferase